MIRFKEWENLKPNYFILEKIIKTYKNLIYKNNKYNNLLIIKILVFTYFNFNIFILSFILLIITRILP